MWLCLPDIITRATLMRRRLELSGMQDPCRFVHLYAPTPKDTLWGSVSLLKASVKPKIGSGGPMGISDHTLRLLPAAAAPAWGLMADTTALLALESSIVEDITHCSNV